MKEIKNRFVDFYHNLKMNDYEISGNSNIGTIDHLKWFFTFGYILRPQNFSFIGQFVDYEVLAFMRGLNEIVPDLHRHVYYEFQSFDPIELSKHQTCVPYGLETNFYTFEPIFAQYLFPLIFNFDSCYVSYHYDTPIKTVKLLNWCFNNIVEGGWLIINDTNLPKMKIALHTFLIKVGNKPIFIDHNNGFCLVQK